MPFQLSPGVQVIEKDFTSIVPAVSSSTGAFAGPFAWGPVEDPIRISSENELVSRFGKPNDANFASFFTAANFLSYTNSMFIVRADSAGLRNSVATKSSGVSTVTLVSAGSGYEEGDTVTVTFSLPQLAGGVRATGTVNSTVDTNGIRVITGVTVTNPGSGYTSAPTVTFSAPVSGSTATATAVINPQGVKIKNVNDFLEDYQLDTGIHGPLAGKFPGDLANNLRVVMLDAGNWSKLNGSEYEGLKNAFTGAPGSSDYALSKGVTNDEMHIAILDTPEGDFSGTPNSLIEKFSFVSKLRDAKRSDGANNFWKSVLNSQSRYVWALGPVADSALSIPPTSVISTGTVSFDGVAKTITTVVADNSAEYNQLETYRQHFNAAADKLSKTVRYNGQDIVVPGAQLLISGTTSNNKVVRVASVTSGAPSGGVSGVQFVITVLENLATETVNSVAVITGLEKQDWNQHSDAFLALTASAGGKTFKVMQDIYAAELTGGVVEYNTTEGQLQTAYSKFTNADEVDIALVATGKVSPTMAAWVVDNVAEIRKDCVVFISPNDYENGLTQITGFGQDATDKIIAYRNALDVSSSYAVMDSGYKYQYDRYNDVYRWVPLNGDIAGLCARTDFTADPWFSPGGYTRGQIKNVVKLAFNPSQTDRDVLYPAGINPVVTFPGQGTVLFGDKTLLAKPSAFDRINVRRLFIVLEKSIATAAKFQLFEFNDGFTRAQFRNLVEPFLRDVQGRRGIVDFRVKCDESNNGGEIIDRNEFVADIFIKPNRSINFITLNFVAARSSVSFEEIGA